MKLVFLGTGTSTGVPTIGCRCDVCLSADPRNKRRRTSLYIEAGDTRILIDTSPDLREQALTHDVRAIDTVLLTHTHADHIFGFDDVRAFNQRGGDALPVFLSESALVDMRRIFPYIEDPNTRGYRPRVDFRVFSTPFQFGNATVTPVEVVHGNVPTFGFRIDGGGCSIGYFPDVERMPEEAYAHLRDLDIMTIDGLRNREHYSHMTIDAAIESLHRIRARQSYLIHMNHEVDHAEVSANLPAGINLSYDGLTLEL
mgnify:CR=1 FL=1